VVVVDASVWIRVLVSQDVHHVIRRQWRRQWVDDGGTFVLPLLLLPEIAGAVTRRTGNATLGDQAVTTLRRNPVIRFVPLDEQLARLAARHAAAFPLKGSDAVYTALAERFGLPLVTWDHEQLTRAAGRIRVRQPAV
jgi:predicted nucleic acid-binding protein